MRIQTPTLPKATGLLAGSTALLSLVAFTNLSVDKVAFTPKEGATVTKTFTTTTSMELDDMTALMNGEAGMIPEMEMTMEMLQTVTVTDEYGKVADGRPAMLIRTYDSISTEMEMEVDAGMGEAATPTGGGSSPLEGSSVVFEWNAEDEAYDTKFAEGEDGDTDLLPGLTENMDLRALLPQEELAVGDTYDIEMSGLVDILAPGGDLKLEMEIDGEAGGGAGMDPEMMTNFREFFEELLEGEATGKYVGLKEVDGVNVAVIELSIAIEASADMSEMAAESMGEEMPEGVEMNMDRMDVEMSYEGAGELHWNMDKGVIYALDLKADMNLNMEMEMGIAMGGQEMAMSMEMAMVGTVENAVTTE